MGSKRSRWLFGGSVGGRGDRRARETAAKLPVHVQDLEVWSLGCACVRFLLSFRAMTDSDSKTTQSTSGTL